MTAIPPELAHLYGDALEEDNVEELVALKAAASRKTTLEELLKVDEPDDDPLDEHDLAELALLVKARLDGPGLPDEDAAELGLGRLEKFEDGEVELVLNETGRAVLKRVLGRG